jgi:hypothetical protein
MKYLILLLLISCISEPIEHNTNCVLTERGNYLGMNFDVFRCRFLPMCEDGDISCLNETKCGEAENGSYICVRRK